MICSLVYRNTLILLVSNYTNAFLNLVSTAILARYLSVEAYGALNASIVTAFLAFQAAELGISAIFTKRVAQDLSRARAEFSRVFALRLVLGAAVLTALLGAVVFLPYGSPTRSLIGFLAVAFLFDFLSDVSISVLRGHESMKEEAILNGLRNVLVLMGSIVWVLMLSSFNAPEKWVGAIFVLASAAKFCLSIKLVRRLASLGFGLGSRDLWREVLAESVPLGLANLMSQLILRLDVLLLAAIRGSREVGIYSSSYNLFSGLMIMSNAFLVSFFPHASRLFARDETSFWTAWSRALVRVTTVTLVVGLGVSIWAREIVLLIYGAGYLETTKVLPFFLGANVFVALSSLCGVGLTTIGASRVITRVHMAGLGLSLLLNWVLISWYGFVGAGVALLVTHGTVFALLFRSIFGKGVLVSPKAKT